MNRNFELLHDELEAALGGLDEQQTQIRPWPSNERWSIQQIVGHLTLTYLATAEAMDARIVKASATRARPSLMQRINQYVVVEIGYFPGGRKAPDRVTPQPESAVPSGPLISRITNGLSVVDTRTTAAEAIFGNRYRAVNHMILGPLSIDQWRRFHLVHGRHHIKQIMAIRTAHKV